MQRLILRVGWIILSFDFAGGDSMGYDEVYEILLDVGRQYGFRPDIPIEAEDFFRALVSTYSGPKERFIPWLEEQAVKYYQSLANRPQWLKILSGPFSKASRCSSWAKLICRKGQHRYSTTTLLSMSFGITTLGVRKSSSKQNESLSRASQNRSCQNTDPAV
jgi:hypothetical protein